MSECRNLDLYLERRLPGPQRGSFEAHLGQCAACASTLERWQYVRESLSEALTQLSPDPSTRGVYRLNRTLASRRPNRGLLVWGSAGLLTAAAVSLLVWVGLRTQTAQEGPRPATHGEIVTASNEEALVLTKQSIRLALAPGGRLRFLEAGQAALRLELLNGRLGAEVPPGRPQGSLVIVVGQLEITDIGTRFGVAKLTQDSVEVVVTQGAVRLSTRRATPFEVAAGHRLVTQAGSIKETEPLGEQDATDLTRLLGPALDQPTAAREDPRDSASPEKDERRGFLGHRRPERAEPSLEEIRQWVLDKQYERAQEALGVRLSRGRGDASAIELLATCQRKQSDYEAAAASYLRLTTLGSAADRNRARFKTGVLYQEHLGRHGDAARMFEAYLHEAPSLRPNTVEAKLRLAESLARLGKTAQRQAVLEDIVASHPGTEAAGKARQLLAETR